MNVRLIAALIAAMGLGACSPDITPQSSDAPSGPTTASAPTQLAAPAAETNKEEGAAPGSEAKRDEGDKKAD